MRGTDINLWNYLLVWHDRTKGINEKKSQRKKRKYSLNPYLLYTTYRIMPTLTLEVESPAIIKQDANEQHIRLALALHQVKSCCISLFEACEYLTCLVPVLLFSLLGAATSHTAYLSRPEPGGKVGQDLVPQGATSSKEQTNYRLETMKENFQSSPRISVPEEPVDNMSLIHRTYFLSKI